MHFPVQNQKGILLKFITMSVALLVLWAGGVSNAGAAGAAACEPYRIPIASSITACDNGQSGSKFRTMSKECPSGVITESQEYDTSNCMAAAPAPGAVNTVNKCIVTPDACALAVIPADCPADSHWTLQGSNIAHCVKNDPTCPWGTTLKHDFLGNPSCEANTCPPGQVLQSDGKSCACPSGQVWNGGSCVPATPTCSVHTQSRYEECESPYTSGERYSNRDVRCPNGPYGAPYYNNWFEKWNTCEGDDSSPTTPAPATCSAGSTTEWAMCAAGGQAMWRYHTTSCPGGPYGAPSTSTSDWDTSLCPAESPASEPAPSPEPAPPPGGNPTPTPEQPPACQDYSVSSRASCGSGYTGEKTVTTYYWCPDGRSTVGEDDSGCGCANGASDYPSCTPPPPPPAQETCAEEERFVDLSNSCPQGKFHTSVALQQWSYCIKNGEMVKEQFLYTITDGVQECFSGDVTWR